MWTRAPTKKKKKNVSNFSPTSLFKSHRSMLKARRIPTSTAALRRRLVQDEGENNPPLTFSSYNTQAKDYPFLSSTLPPRGVKLTLTAEYHRYEKPKPDTKPTLFWKLSSLGRVGRGGGRKQASYEYFSIWSPWETWTARLSATVFVSCTSSRKHINRFG